MRRLQEQQIVEIHLDSDDPAITCRVASVAGAVATLIRDEESSEVAALLAPAAPGHLVFEHQGSLVALRGIAAALSADEPTLEFVVIDNVVLPERRAAERVPLAAGVRIWSAGESDDNAPSVETITADVSISGALLERRPGLTRGQVFAMKLLFSPDPAPISCNAELVRETPTHIGVKFVDMPEADRARLAGIIFRHQRARQKPRTIRGLVTARR